MFYNRFKNGAAPILTQPLLAQSRQYDAKNYRELVNMTNEIGDENLRKRHRVSASNSADHSPH